MANNYRGFEGSVTLLSPVDEIDIKAAGLDTTWRLQVENWGGGVLLVAIDEGTGYGNDIKIRSDSTNYTSLNVHKVRLTHDGGLTDIDYQVIVEGSES